MLTMPMKYMTPNIEDDFIKYLKTESTFGILEIIYELQIAHLSIFSPCDTHMVAMTFAEFLNEQK